jgi:hypothetical protein
MKSLYSSEQENSNWEQHEHVGEANTNSGFSHNNGSTYICWMDG